VHSPPPSDDGTLWLPQPTSRVSEMGSWRCYNRRRWEKERPVRAWRPRTTSTHPLHLFVYCGCPPVSRRMPGREPMATSLAPHHISRVKNDMLRSSTGSMVSLVEVQGARKTSCRGIQRWRVRRSVLLKSFLGPSRALISGGWPTAGLMVSRALLRSCR